MPAGFRLFLMAAMGDVWPPEGLKGESVIVRSCD